MSCGLICHRNSKNNNNNNDRNSKEITHNDKIALNSNKSQNQWCIGSTTKNNYTSAIRTIPTKRVIYCGLKNKTNFSVMHIKTYSNIVINSKPLLMRRLRVTLFRG